MISPSLKLKQAIFVSLLGHITIFGIFSVSLGNKVLKQNYAKVYALGAILKGYDLIRFKNFNIRHIDRISNYYLNSTIDTNTLGKESRFSEVIKPAVSLVFEQDKINPVQQLTPLSATFRRKEPVIMFHPHLPEHFLLYFKDRQAVHIELMFELLSRGKVNSITIKRKISSGNLEVDLLAMRYIGHYLFIQQDGLYPLDKWETVKIDLSAKND